MGGTSMTVKIPKALKSFGGDISTNIKRLIDSKLNSVHTSTIGIIESFDSETQTAVVQPAIKRVTATQSREFITYETEQHPLLVDIPVVFPGGGEWFMTFPIQKGDECIIHSMERSIDTWKKNGGLQEPSNYTRKLSFKDAVAIVGIQSKADALPTFNTSNPELRNRDGDVKLTMSDIGITVNDGEDYAVRYSELETAYNDLKQTVNDLITAYNSHTHVLTLSSGTGTAASTATTATESTGDITGAKVEEILIP